MAQELAPKVNLFRDAWATDPNTEFFGGTVRDYLYWLKGRFRNASSSEEAHKIAESLRSLPMIDIRDFVIGESDIDAVSRTALPLDPARYGVKKIDFIDKERFNPSTELGASEIRQGFIPVEKIRLGKSGFVRWDNFGDGIREIYVGRPTVHMPDPEAFKTTFYARKKANHPLLLAIRYLRTLGINYFNENGSEYPNFSKLMSIDPESERTVKEAIARTIKTRDLGEYLKNGLFQQRFNETTQKAFRSYTNPTATHMLFKEFGMDRIIGEYSDKLDPVNQYLFARAPKDPARMREQLQELGTTSETLFSKPSREFSDLNLYHGTETEEAFRAILSQGILPSTAGAAGKGLYAVDQTNLSFAAQWGRSPDRVVRFQVSPDARVIDTTAGEGARLLAKFHGDFDALADATGADILRYPYSVRAYVVKNSAVLGKPSGHLREFLSYGRLLDRAKEADTIDSSLNVMKNAQVSHFNRDEISRIIDEIPYFKKPENAKLLSLARGLASPGLSNDVMLSSFRSAIALTALAKDATKQVALEKTMDGATTAINDLVRVLSQDQRLTDAQKNDLLKRLADAVFDSANPKGNQAVRSALVTQIVRTPSDFGQRVRVYLNNPLRKMVAGLGAGMATTWVPLGLLYHDSSLITHTGIGLGAVWSMLFGATLKDANAEYRQIFGGNDRELRKNQVRAIKSLKQYFESLEQGKSFSLSPYQTVGQSKFSPASGASCISRNLRKLWSYDQNIAMLAFGAAGYAGYHGVDALIEFMSQKVSPSPAPQKKAN